MLIVTSGLKTLATIHFAFAGLIVLVLATLAINAIRFVYEETVKSQDILGIGSGIIRLFTNAIYAGLAVATVAAVLTYAFWKGLISSVVLGYSIAPWVTENLSYEAFSEVLANSPLGGLPLLGLMNPIIFVFALTAQAWFIVIGNGLAIPLSASAIFLRLQGI